MGARPNQVLRRQMKERGHTCDTLGERIGKSRCYISDVLSGKTTPKLEVAYDIMDALLWPYEDMWILFPRNGVDVERKPKDEVTEYCEKAGKVLMDRGIVKSIKALAKIAI